MLLSMSSLSISSVDLSSSDCIDLEAGGPVNLTQNTPSLFLRVFTHYKYNYLLYFKPRWIVVLSGLKIVQIWAGPLLSFMVKPRHFASIYREQ